MSTKIKIKSVKDIYGQFIDDWKKLKKIQNFYANQLLEKVDRCKIRDVMKEIKDKNF